jgi:hypothetical protein
MVASMLIVPIASGQIALTTAQIAKRVSPSVVVIQGKTDSGDVLGSGFIVSKDGKIVTNLHVIRDMKAASVQLANREIFDSVSVLATDERRDLAILKVAGFDLSVLDLGNSDALTVGEPLVIVGSPRGLEGTVTAGILSSVRDSGDGFKVLQTDAAVNPGNSGGPLVNNKGQAIGVVSFKLRSAGLNFAIPINYVRGLLNNLHEPMTLEQMRQLLVNTKSTAQRGSGASLKETLDWLKEKIPLATVNYVHSAFDEDGHTITTSRSEQGAVMSFESCTVAFGSVEVETTAPRNIGSTHSIQFTVPLGILTTGYVDRVEVAALSMSMAGYSPTIFDFDNDGWKDIFITRGHVQSLQAAPRVTVAQPNTVFRNLGGLKSGIRFDGLTGEAGLAAQPPRRHRGSAADDFNGDGRLDVVVTAIGARAEIWMNQSPGANHWLELKLEGTKSNRDAIGARVKVVTGNKTQFNHVTTSCGYASSSAGPMHFGVGADASIDLGEIRWPSGQVQQLKSVRPDRVVRVKEPPL